MSKPPDQHLSFKHYGQAADALHVLSGMGTRKLCPLGANTGSPASGREHECDG